MNLTNDRIRRKRYKQLWYQKKRAKEMGNKGRFNAIEAEIDKIRKVKREPIARKKQLKLRSICYKKAYYNKKKSGYFRYEAQRYRHRHYQLCLARDRYYSHHLSYKQRQRCLAKHREWNRNHLKLIRKRALDYAKSHRQKARENARKYYYKHKQDK